MPTNPLHPFQIVNKKGEAVGSAQTKNGARMVRDRLDNNYGGYQHTIMPSETDLHSDLAAKHSIYSGQDRANNSIFGKTPDPGRTSAIKERFKQSRTSGNPMTQGETKYSAIGANKGPDMGRIKATYAVEQSSSLASKASATLKGGGGQGEADKLSELGSTQDEINKAKKATKGFSIVPEGF